MKEKIEIVFVMVIALLISMATGKLFFINNTPSVRPLAVSDVTNSITAWLNNLAPANNSKKAPAEENNEAVFSTLGQIAFSPVSSGVAAREDNGVSETVYEVNSVTWKEYTFTTKKGKTLKIKVAEDQEPPPQALIDLIH